jgi:hypothetical protein
MKKFYTVVLVFGAFLLVSNNIFAQKAPQIAAMSPHYDFGEILEGQVVSHTFEIQNVGDADLKIDKVRASCGCTAVQPAKTDLKPGEKTTIRAEFDSHNRMGIQNKLVYVFSNDPKNPQFQLSFNAVVVDKLSPPKGAKVPALVLDKNEYDFGEVEEGKMVEAKIGFKNIGEGTLEIIDVKTSCGCTAALLSSKKLAPGEKGTVRIELDTAGREGKMTRTVSLYTNDPSNPTQTITLFVNIDKRKS